jgi:hypothetical protein
MQAPFVVSKINTSGHVVYTASRISIHPCSKVHGTGTMLEGVSAAFPKRLGRGDPVSWIWTSENSLHALG